MPDREMNLNSLSRFSKRSPHLVLLEYGHCEVPSGCGGMVLRWWKPDEPIPMAVRSFARNGQRRRLALDGKEPEFLQRVPVPYGRHALTIVIEEVDPAFAFVFMAAKLDEQCVRVLGLQGDTVVLSLPDGTWRCSLEEPDGEAWHQPGFDDRSWQPLVERPLAEDPLAAVRGGRFGSLDVWTRSLLHQGAKGIGLPPPPAPRRRRLLRAAPQTVLPVVYVRKEFEVRKGGQG